MSTFYFISNLSQVRFSRKNQKSSLHQVKISFKGLADILSEFDDGVIITDEDGIILFYNKALSRIDNIDRTLAIGKKISEVYNVSEESSPTMQCLRQRRPILRFVEFYLTRQGRAVSALQNAVDLKGGLSVQLYTMKLLKLLKDHGRMKGNLIFSAVVHEEAAEMFGMEYLCKHTLPDKN